MFHKGKFEDYIDGFWLGFKQKELEERLSFAKENLTSKMSMFKAFVLIYGIFMSLTVGYVAYAYYTTDKYSNAWVMITCIIVGCVSIGLEFIIQYFNKLRQLRGYCVTIGFFFIAAYGSTDGLDAPAFSLG